MASLSLVAAAGAVAAPDPLDVLRFRWELVGFPTGAEPVLDGASATAASLTAAKPGQYTVRLVVSDGDLSSPPAWATLVVEEEPAPDACGCATGSGELAFLMLLAPVVTAWAARRRAPAGRP